MLPEAVEMVCILFICYVSQENYLNYHLSLDNIRIVEDLLLTVYTFEWQVVPGDNATLTIELIYPVPMADGLRFALREGGKTVGAGVVIKVME